MKSPLCKVVLPTRVVALRSEAVIKIWALTITSLLAKNQTVSMLTRLRVYHSNNSSCRTMFSRSLPVWENSLWRDRFSRTLGNITHPLANLKNQGMLWRKYPQITVACRAVKMIDQKVGSRIKSGSQAQATCLSTCKMPQSLTRTHSSPSWPDSMYMIALHQQRRCPQIRSRHHLLSRLTRNLGTTSTLCLIRARCKARRLISAALRRPKKLPKLRYSSSSRATECRTRQSRSSRRRSSCKHRPLQRSYRHSLPISWRPKKRSMSRW